MDRARPQSEDRPERTGHTHTALPFAGEYGEVAELSPSPDDENLSVDIDGALVPAPAKQIAERVTSVVCLSGLTSSPRGAPGGGIVPTPEY